MTNSRDRKHRSRSMSYRRGHRERSYRRSPPTIRGRPTTPLSPRNDDRFSRDSPSQSRRRSPRSRTHSTERSVSRSHGRSEHYRRGNRERPSESRCIGVFGLNVYTTQQKIRELFSKFGAIERIQVVIDAKTRRSRGFCFIYYENLADAKAAKETCSGMEIDGRRMRVDYSITQRPHTPTPGVYMGQPTRYYRGRNDRYRHEYHSRRRSSHSPYSSGSGYKEEYRRRYDRSRSRDYSPRRMR